MLKQKSASRIPSATAIERVRAHVTGSIGLEQIALLVVVAIVGMSSMGLLGRSFGETVAGNARGDATTLAPATTFSARAAVAAQAAGLGDLEKVAEVAKRAVGSAQEVDALTERVGGLRPTLERIWETVGAPLKHETGEIDQLALLHGPDGVGKTELAHSLADVAGAEFEVLDARFYTGERRFVIDGVDGHDRLVEQIERRVAEGNKHLIYMPNVESIGLTETGTDVVAAQDVMARMRSALAGQHNVAVIGSVEDLGGLDAHLLDEAGGFGESFALRRPDEKELAEITKVRLGDVVKLEEGLDPATLSEELAPEMEGFLGADVRNAMHLANLEAERSAIHRALEEGGIAFDGAKGYEDGFLAMLPSVVTSERHCPCRGSFRALDQADAKLPQYVLDAFLATVGEFDAGIKQLGQDNASSLYRYSVADSFKRQWLESLPVEQRNEYMNAWLLRTNAGKDLEYSVSKADLQAGIDEVRDLLGEDLVGTKTTNDNRQKVIVQNTGIRKRVR